jgi:energy-converting hydrogenase Eha subunit C
MSLDGASRNSDPGDSAPIYGQIDCSNRLAGDKIACPTKIRMRDIVMRRIHARWLAGSTIFLSSFLLFSIQPMFAKMILPWFGDSAAVWTTCLVFFQTALLAGYWYAWLAVKRLRPHRQAIAHTILLAAAIALLPVEAGPQWRPAADAPGHPAVRILAMLTAVLGLPYVLLSTTGPLLQSWYARMGRVGQADVGQAAPAGAENEEENPSRDSAESATGSRPYRLFALSNAGALIALMAYPLWIEPRLPVHAQERLWSIGFVIFAVLCAITAWMAAKGGQADMGQASPAPPNMQATRSPAPLSTAPLQRLEWIALAAVGSMLLLATTNQLTQNVAPVPLLWIVPLAIYLLTFILTFESARWYRRDVLLRLLAIALASVAYAIYDIQLSDAMAVSIPLFCAALFLGCMFCHGELNRRKPGAGYLTSFYMMIALGGAVGAVSVGLIAPVIFSGVYELPVAMLALAVLVLWMNRETETSRDAGWPQRLLWLGVTAAMAVMVATQVRAYHRGAVELERSFYGSLRVVDSGGVRTLYHGTVEHGSQFLDGFRDNAGRMTPTTYYGRTSGVGIALRYVLDETEIIGKRVGVIGLGAGTLAAYGRAGDEFHFYEINPQVVGIARRRFTYLDGSPARIEITLGDARLSLESEAAESKASGSGKAGGVDVLVVDAFSGDAIPVHLLTKEAFALYLGRLKPLGLLAIHVSNQYLDLAPVVGQLASLYDLPAIEIRSAKDESSRTLEAVWILMTRDRNFLRLPEIVNPGNGNSVVSVPLPPTLRVWTDDYNNLLQVMRWIPNQ